MSRAVILYLNSLVAGVLVRCRLYFRKKPTKTYGQIINLRAFDFSYTDLEVFSDVFISTIRLRLVAYSSQLGLRIYSTVRLIHV